MMNVRGQARAVGLAAISLVSGAVFGMMSPSNAGADAPVSAFYLAIGGSASVGVQPTVSYPKGQRTDYGYADYLVTEEAAKGVTLDLHELGCSGETTNSMLNGGDRCYAWPDTQLNEALEFLQSHQDENGLVTLDLGFNDLRPCFHDWTTDSKCVEAHLDTVQQQLTQIVALLQYSAGPRVKFVGVGHYDPFLADSLTGHATTAKWSLRIVRHLDEILSSVYESAGIPIADVGDAFKISSTLPVDLAGVGTVPENVADVCLMTWMCQPAPLGPNIHPNDAGYQTIADAIDQVITPW